MGFLGHLIPSLNKDLALRELDEETPEFLDNIEAGDLTLGLLKPGCANSGGCGAR